MELVLLKLCCALIVVVGSNGLAISSRSSPCGDWTPYLHETCIKFAGRSGTQNKEDAKHICQSFGEELHQDDAPTLLTIKTKEKQEWITKFLFEERATFDNVWLDLDMDKEGSFHWNDGSQPLYSNWADQNVSDSGRQCVQLESGEGTFKVGSWSKVHCQKRNAIVCERMQPWSFSTLQSLLTRLTLEVEKNKAEAEKKLNAVTEELLRANADSESKMAEMTQVSEKKINAFKQESDSKMAKMTQESEKKINELKQESDSKMAEMTQESEKRINTLKHESESKIAAVSQASEERVNALKQESESKLAEVSQASESRINALKQESETKTAEVKLEAERKINTLKLEAEAKINAVKLESQSLVATATQEIAALKHNPVPVGYLYIQLPDKQPPTTLWPQISWKDVTVEYAGLFFRAEGGGSAPFGQVQEDNTRRLAQVSATHIDGPAHPIIPEDGSWSEFRWTGSSDGKPVSVRYRLTTGEIRPRNKAVKIWQRV